MTMTSTPIRSSRLHLESVRCFLAFDYLGSISWVVVKQKPIQYAARRFCQCGLRHQTYTSTNTPVWAANALPSSTRVAPSVPRRDNLICAHDGRSQSRKPNGYWADIRNIREEIASLQNCNSNFPVGEMPIAQKLRKEGRRDLDNAISKMGGYVKVANMLGLSRSSGRRGAGYWNNFANLESSLRDFIKANSDKIDEGMMPTQKQLRQLKHSDIDSALKQHGGSARVAKKLDLEVAKPRKSAHYWKDWSKVETEVKAFVKQREEAMRGTRKEMSEPLQRNRALRMPSQKELRAIGRADLAQAISDYHGGFRTAASKLGLISRKKDDYFYDKFDNVAREIYEFVDSVGQESIMPSTVLLKDEGRTDLVAAVVKFGGMSQVSQRLGLQYRVRTREAFKDWRLFRNSIEVFTKKFGRPGEIPSSRTLTNFGREDLYQAILHHGGTKEVADRMGLKRNFWQDFHNVGRQVLEFVDIHGTEGIMPTEGEFAEVGRSTLNVAVSKFGHSQVAQRLGLREPPQSPQVALDAFLSQSLSLVAEHDECDNEKCIAKNCNLDFQFPST